MPWISKTNVAASFRHEAGRDVHGPGLYVSLAPGEVEIGGGVWHPEAEPLRLIREAIVERPAAWRRAVTAPARPAHVVGHVADQDAARFAAGPRS